MLVGRFGIMNAKMMPRPTAKRISYNARTAGIGRRLTHDTLDDKQPSPALDTMSAVELKNGERKETTKGVSDLGSGVQNRRSKRHAFLFVKHREEKDCSGEELQGQ